MAPMEKLPSSKTFAVAGGMLWLSRSFTDLSVNMQTFAKCPFSDSYCRLDEMQGKLFS